MRGLLEGPGIPSVLFVFMQHGILLSRCCRVICTTAASVSCICAAVHQFVSSRVRGLQARKRAGIACLWPPNAEQEPRRKFVCLVVGSTKVARGAELTQGSDGTKYPCTCSCFGFIQTRRVSSLPCRLAGDNIRKNHGQILESKNWWGRCDAGCNVPLPSSTPEVGAPSPPQSLCHEVNFAGVSYCTNKLGYKRCPLYSPI